MTFRPRLDVLPAAQRRLWPALADVPDTFVLYGGTALALRLAHHASVDFDFCAAEPPSRWTPTSCLRSRSLETPMCCNGNPIR